MNRQRRSINSIVCSSSRAQYVIIYVKNQTKQNLFTFLALGRAWLPTHQALLKVTVVRTLPGARPTVELARPSVSEQVRTPPPAKLRNYRNLPTACKLLLLVCDSHPASDLPPHSITAKFTTLWLVFTSLERQASQRQFLCWLKTVLLSRLGQKTTTEKSLFQSIAFHIYGSVATRIAVGWYVHFCFTNCNWAHIWKSRHCKCNMHFRCLAVAKSILKCHRCVLLPVCDQMVPQNWSLTLPKEKKKR